MKNTSFSFGRDGRSGSIAASRRTIDHVFLLVLHDNDVLLITAAVDAERNKLTNVARPNSASKDLQYWACALAVLDLVCWRRLARGRARFLSYNFSFGPRFEFEGPIKADVFD